MLNNQIHKMLRKRKEKAYINKKLKNFENFKYFTKLFKGKIMSLPY